jgi:hypothetical protein
MVREQSERLLETGPPVPQNIIDKFKKEFITRFSTLYKGWGALSRSSGLESLIVFHTGTAEHFHVQLKKDWSKIKIPKEKTNETIH